jgi:hypothetical protein
VQSLEKAERAARTPPADCKCAGCAGLARRYKGDPDLLAFYRRRLLQKGWAGNIDDVEAAYMFAHAPWYKGAVERGRERAQQTGFGKRFGGVGEASAAKDEELAPPGDGGQLDGGSDPQEQGAQPGVQLGLGLGEV